MLDFDPTVYGSTVEGLLVPSRLAELGPGSPDESRREKLAAMTEETLLSGRTLVDREMALACLAGLWLYHDFLDCSHEISQELSSTTGSYWHALMHRREPDPGNSKYWFHRVRQHPVFPALYAAAREVDAAGQIITSRQWDPGVFVDACESARGRGSPDELLCRQIQLLEWQILFDYCFTHAGKG